MALTARDLEKHLQHVRGSARGAEILVETSAMRQLSTTRREGLSERTWGSDLATVRCWDPEGRVGLTQGPSQDISSLLDDALARCATSAPDPFAGPVERMQGALRGLDIDDRRHPLITWEERAEILTTNERAAGRECPGAETGTFSLEERRERRVVANTRGVQHEAWSTQFLCRGSLRAPSPDGPVDLADSIGSRVFASVACMPFGNLLGQRLNALCGPGAELAGEVRILLPPRASARLISWLGERFAESSTTPGSTLLDATPPLRLHKRLHLLDDGLLAGAWATRGFDDRGVPPVPLTLLREGEVNARMIDVHQARVRDLRPTGHDVGGKLRPTNLVLNSGTRSINALLADHGGTVLLVDDLSDLSGLNTTTGELDVTVHGVRLDRGKPVGAVRNARLRGNIIDVLQRVAAVASDTDRILHVDAPGLLLDGLTVTRAGS